jgi:hypothetical protein
VVDFILKPKGGKDSLFDSLRLSFSNWSASTTCS